MYKCKLKKNTACLLVFTIFFTILFSSRPMQVYADVTDANKKYTFADASQNSGNGFNYTGDTGVSSDGFFKVKSSKFDFGSDNEAVWLAPTLSQDTADEETVYIEVTKHGSLGSFILDEVDVGEYDDGAFNNITVKGYVNGVEVFSTVPYSDPKESNLGSKHYTTNLTPAAGIQIDSFRIYYTKPYNLSLGFTHNNFMFYGFTTSSASTMPPTVSKVLLSNDSVAGLTAGNSAITGLDSSKEYNVQIVDGANASKYVNASGVVGDTPIAITGVTNITGLTNGTTYRVVDLTLTKPTITNVSTSVVIPNSLSATSNKNGTIYLISKAATITNKASLDKEVTDGKGKMAAVTANTSVSISTTGLIAGTYVAYAVDEAGNLSNKSSDIALVTPPSAPTNLTATAGDKQVTLSWSGVAGVTSYKVYQGTDPLSLSLVKTVTELSTDITGLNNGTAYYFAIKASKDGADSLYSNQIRETPIVYITALTTIPSKVDAPLEGTILALPVAVGSNTTPITSTLTEVWTLESGGNVGALAVAGTTYTYKATFTAPIGYKFASSMTKDNAVVSSEGREIEYTFTVVAKEEAPKVSTVVVPVNKVYTKGETLDFRVTFDKRVNVTGTPTLDLTIGSTVRKANYASGNASDSILFSYTVQEGEEDKDGITLGALGLNGGSIKSISGINDAVLTLNNVPATSDIKIDAVAPVLSNTGASVVIPNNFSSTSSENGTIYLVSKAATITNVASLEKEVTDGRGKKEKSTANLPVQISTMGLTAGDYLVYAVDEVGNISNKSSDIAVLNRTSAPIMSSAVAGDKEVTLNWSSVAGATNYKIYQGTNMLTLAPVKTVAGTELSTDITGLTNGITYYFVVTAIGVGGESVNSNEVSVMPKVATTEITSFNPIQSVLAGNAGTATYVNAAAVIAALPKAVKANGDTVTVPVSMWLDTDSYNPNLAGSYTFTAILGVIPAGYANSGNYTATVEVILGTALKYTVSFDSQGGSPVSDISNINLGDKITAPASPIRPNSTFGGWYKEGTCTNAWNFGTDTVTSNIILYAKWTANPTYTITYTAGANGSITGSASQTVNSGTSGSAVTAVANSGYHFIGWSDGVATATRTDKNISGNINVTANFAQNTPPTPPTPPEPIPDKGTGTVIDEKTGETVKAVEIKVKTEWDGSKTLSLKAQEALVFKEASGTRKPLSDISKLNFGNNKNIELSPEGTIQIKNIAKGTEVNYPVTYDLGQGEKIIIGSIKIKTSDKGEVSLCSELIDPYGVITDAATGKIIEGANVVLYYAATDRNKSTGKKLNAEVVLPTITGFEPNDNKNPQNSDKNGSYAFMVFPTTDYYLVATKEGYETYTSPVISVEQEIVRHDFKMTLKRNEVTLNYTAGANGSVIGNTNQTIELGESGSTVRAVPNTGYHFAIWSDGVTTAERTDSNVKDNINVIAKFEINTNNTKRLGGENRVDTALKIAKATFKDKIKNVVIATADNYPDALVGSVLAYKNDAPILLIGSSDSDVEKVISYMKDSMEVDGTVYILGGTGAVSGSVEEKIKGSGFQTIKRISGADRYETAVKISDSLHLKEGGTVVLTSGENFPDALSISSIAAINQYPILLVEKNQISESVKKKLQELKPSKVIIMGLQGAISEEVEKQISQITILDKSNIVRIGGEDRFETSIKVAQQFNLLGDTACVATGNDFPDALAGSIYAAKNKANIILVDTTLTEEAKEYLKNSKISTATIFGETGAVNKEIQEEIYKLINK